MAYKSTLLSILIPIRYEKALDTIEDLDKSGLGLLIFGSTVQERLTASDPRPAMKRIYERREVIPWNPHAGRYSQEYDDR